MSWERYNADAGVDNFKSYLDKSPKFSGDVLFHLRLDKLIMICHEARFSSSIGDYYNALFGFFAEIHPWIDNEEQKQALKEKIRKVSTNIHVSIKSNRNDDLTKFELINELNDIFFTLCEVARPLILKSESKKNYLSQA